EVTTAVVGNAQGGLLNAEQSNRFIDFVVDQSNLMKNARVVRMRTPTMDIDKVSVGTRLMAKATEASDTGANAAVTFTKVSLSSVKLRLDWELSTESLEDNISGASLEDHLAQIMARQTANDLDDLLINGNTSSGNALLKALDGFVKLALAAGVTIDEGGNNVSRATFDRLIRNMPSKYLQKRNELRFFSGSNLVQDISFSLQAPNSATAATAGAAAPGSTYGEQAFLNGAIRANGGPGATGISPYGIPLLELPLMPETVAGDYSGATGNHSYIGLTFPNNKVVGLHRDITVYRQFQPKTDTIEYTQFMRVAANIENAASYIIAKNVKLRTL
ncbi:phage major capsid protein, partial [Candidatus Dependentiae bacterium]|nr:phage major capsid protein [Candidatus Dependentiae bacterium]